MSLKPLLSFSSGELDPVLTDNVTLEKFQKGLSTARNVMIGKTGSILSRFSRYHLVEAKTPNKNIKLYCPPNTDYLLEWGDAYVRIYTVAFIEQTPFLILDVELVQPFVEVDLPNLHFVTSKDYVYIFCAAKKMKKLFLGHGGSFFTPDVDTFEVLSPLSPIAVTQLGAPTGYKVDYLATVVVNGEESLFVENTTGYNKPIASGQSNTVTVGWVTADLNSQEVSEVRFYSRPTTGGAYGFLGSTTKIITVGLNQVADFQDIGSLPDFNNGVQDLITKYGLNGSEIIDLNPKTGAVYQQRLVLGNVTNDNEALLASRPGYQNNFYRDFPYAADSSLQFKAGTSGKAKVLRIVESDGLIVFTTNGVYINSGLLSVNNLALDRRGGWIINESLPPLVVPGGVFFVDKSNTIRQLIFSQDIQAYESLEQTIFSNHLFKNRTIKTWAYQDGLVPLIIVSFSDGTWVTFTYNFEHQMRAWTRHDSKYPIEQVEGTDKSDRTFFVTNKNGVRYIEVNLPRTVPVEVKSTNPESDKLSPNTFMDSIETVSNLMNYGFDVGENFIISPVVPADWEGDLDLTTNFGLDFTGFVVGDVLRVFNPSDKSVIDLTILSFTSPTEIVVSPSEEFPSTMATSARIYTTTNIVTGLNHLEGESVSVMVDGYIIASPYNDVENYPALTVTGGSITLPDGILGAIIHVGRPIVADIATLNISTVEQSPTLIESLTVNKLYIRVNDSRGLYCSNEFPEEKEALIDGNSVQNMESIDVDLVPVNDIIIGNRYLPSVSKRIEKTLPGSWNTQGKMCMRQVDPFHFEILSIVADIEVFPRSNR